LRRQLARKVNYLPRRRAEAMPAFVRSLIISRSIAANAARAMAQEASFLMGQQIS
jgi:hypothetical protein